MVHPRSPSTDVTAAGGWYLARGIVPGEVEQGSFGRVQAVATDGQSVFLPLGRLRAGRLSTTVVMLPHGCSGVSVCAESWAGSVSMPGWQWRKLSRAAAFGHMLWKLRDEAGRFHPLQSLITLLRMSARILQGRPRGAGDVLRDAYQASLGGYASSAAGARCRLHTTLWGAREEAIWIPSSQLKAHLGPEPPDFEATGADPQFRLDRASRFWPLPAGWYRIQFVISVVDGCLVAPALYPDYGNGCEPQDMVGLPDPGTAGLVHALVRFRSPVRNLRFDPSTAPARFKMDQFTIDRVGRATLLPVLLNQYRLANPERDWRDLSSAMFSLASRAMRATGYESGSGDGTLAAYGARCRLRSRLWGARQEAIWFASHQLRSHSENGEYEFEATGGDPQFRLERAGHPSELAAGWYRVHCVTSTLDGRLLAPAFYPDYGSGCEAENMLRLPEPGADGVIRALVMFKARVRSLRFDPSLRPARFKIEDFTMDRVGRPAALLLLFDRYRCSDGKRDWRGLIAALHSFSIIVMRHGLSVAASQLHDGRVVPGNAGGDYTNWVRLYDTHGGADRRLWKERVRGLKTKPLISILLPAYETPERLLRQCLDSVVGQAYDNWELCAVDDASASPHVSRVLAEYAARDTRVRWLRRDTNGHISAASNDALAMAAGTYVALLDHDDELRPHALLEVAEQLVAHPDVGLVYSDEDKIDERGRRFDPNFKPDWNPDLLLSQNYISHFTVIAAAALREVGGFRKGFEGSQDHDLFLRCIEKLLPSHIRHVPKVLYHWRAVSGSTALSRDAKDYASAAGVRAVADHLSRVAPGARAEELEHGHYRVFWPLPDSPPKVSIIIPTRDRLDLLRTCIESVLENTAYPDFEIIVVDNQSREPDTLAYFDRIQGDKRIQVLAHDAPFNYSSINNRAAQHAGGEVLCLLNNDIEVVSAGWLTELVSHAIRPEIGAVGAMLYYPDRTIQHAGVILGLGGIANHIYSGAPERSPGHGARALVAQNLSAVTGACLVVERTVYEQVGGLDERLQVAFNDIDFCLRLLEAGYRNVWTPFAELVHHESQSRGLDASDEQRARFLGEVAHMEARWGGYLDCDAAYNPNLSLESLSAELAFPPRAARPH